MALLLLPHLLLLYPFYICYYTIWFCWKNPRTRNDCQSPPFYFGKPKLSPPFSLLLSARLYRYYLIVIFNEKSLFRDYRLRYFSFFYTISLSSSTVQYLTRNLKIMLFFHEYNTLTAFCSFFLCYSIRKIIINLIMRKALFSPLFLSWKCSG